jgi:predicted RNA-binding protein with PIN domain
MDVRSNHEHLFCVKNIRSMGSLEWSPGAVAGRRYARVMTEAGDNAAIETRHLRSALEFAVTIAREGQKIKPPLKFPAALKPLLKAQRIPAGSLGRVRRAIEADDAFRTRLAAGALPELVDEIGRLWLARPDGWEHEAHHLAIEADAAAEAADLGARLKQSDKRRDAAEQAAARVRAENVVLTECVAERDTVIDGLRSDVVKLTESIDELRAELADTRLEARHARDRESAAVTKLDAALSARDAAMSAQGQAETVRDHVLADRAVLAAERSELMRLAAAASSLAEQLGALADPPASGRPVVRRKALPLPGGVLGSSEAAAEYLLRSGASVLIDGYNVAKLAWPDLDLAGQRVVLLDALENAARRFGGDITVVFDGAGVVGASADRRRVVRVVYSPPDVIADDVIRDEVRRLPATRPVVVVTNDQAIVRDVRALGGNTLASEQLIALMR